MNSTTTAEITFRGGLLRFIFYPAFSTVAIVTPLAVALGSMDDLETRILDEIQRRATR